VSLPVPLRELKPNKSAVLSPRVPLCLPLSLSENDYESEGRRFESCRAHRKIQLETTTSVQRKRTCHQLSAVGAIFSNISGYSANRAEVKLPAKQPFQARFGVGERLTRKMSRSAVRIRSSALLNTLSRRLLSLWDGSSEKARPATARRGVPPDDKPLCGPSCPVVSLPLADRGPAS
jgi:hypothetical protein